MKQELNELFGHIFEDELLNEIITNGIEKNVKAGEILIDYGQNLQFMPLLLDGALKITREDTEGDELLLYYIENGDTCSVTLSCCMGNTTSKIRAIAERDSYMVMIPVSNMLEWMQKYQGWMAFVFESYNNRFNELLSAIDSLAFSNMHQRLFKYLKDKVLVNKSTELKSTHQEIANDLHTSRVVVSRLLKNLEREGKIKLHRNRLEVLEF
jgi:CRP/FNR family transcriptional regulator